MKRLTTLVAVGAALLSIPATASAVDYADTALNILPSGQSPGLPPDPDADRQARMYDGLTPLFDQVGPGDLTTFFKSEALGSLGTDGPGTDDPIPGRPDIQITRDAYDVPHVVAQSYEGGIFAAGWIAAKDRGLLLQQARNNARVAAIDAPGLSAIDLISNLESFVPSEQTEAMVARQERALLREGREGRAVLADIDTFLSGINYFFSINNPDAEPFTRNDIFALNSLKSQFLGQGGGDEARRSQFLGGLQKRLGEKRGMSVFNDLRQFKNAGSPTSVDGTFDYGSIPKRAPGSVVLDPNSFKPTPSVDDPELTARYAGEPTQASNTLMIDAKRSATGNPLMVGGPQISYFFPGLVYEIDMQAPGLVWRGSTSAPFPGYLLIGRGEDFANTLTSASGDIIDQYAEKLCGGSDTKYMYKGRCRQMKTFDAGTLNGEPVSFKTTVHGPVVGYARADGEKVAISRKRSSLGSDVVDLLFNRRLSTGAVHSPKSFFRAASKSPQTFNSFYIDDESIAEFTSGRLPIRPAGTDPGLPTLGTGQYEWEGFISKGDHPQGVDPKDGVMTNWNNSVARGFGAADDEWGRNGSAARVDLLDKNLARLKRAGKWSLATVVSAMNAAATQDIRAIDTVPLLKRLLKGAKAPSGQAKEMVRVLVDWRNSGGSRLDRDLDGKIDHPGAAIMDASWNRIANAFMRPQLGPQLDELNSLFNRFDAPQKESSDGQFAGWYQYFDRDIRKLLGMKQPDPFANSYCGKGDLERCQRDIYGALAAAGRQLEAEQGTADPSAWRADATEERIEFKPLPLIAMRYANRPSGIQQVISFKGHRPGGK